MPFYLGMVEKRKDGEEGDDNLFGRRLLDARLWTTTALTSVVNAWLVLVVFVVVHDEEEVCESS